jgi:hypothetical protein
MSEVSEEERFSKNTVILGQAIHNGILQLYSKGYKTVDPLSVQMVMSIMSLIDKNRLIRGFIENSHKICWDNIRERNEIYFAENASEVFKDLPVEKVNLFKDLYLTKDETGKSVMPQTFKNQIWDLFDAMIRISIKYIHKHRGPYSSGDLVNGYQHEFLPEVDLPYHAEKWKVELKFPKVSNVTKVSNVYQNSR